MKRNLLRLIVSLTLLIMLGCILALMQQKSIYAKTSSAEYSPSLIPGLGSLYHPVSTNSADAQRFFNQGLTLLYGFNHNEAIRSFKYAAELDPQLAMAHWGIALALGPNINSDKVLPADHKAADEAIQKASTLASNASKHEQAYIAALVKRYSSDPG